jgi:hypothetical protein
VAERVWNDDEIFFGIERLPRPEQFAGKGGRQHALSGTAGPMQNNNRNSVRLADRPVMEAHLGQNLAGVEFEVARDPIPFLRRRVVGGTGGERARHKDKKGSGSEKDHGVSSFRIFQ